MLQERIATLRSVLDIVYNTYIIKQQKPHHYDEAFVVLWSLLILSVYGLCSA